MQLATVLTPNELRVNIAHVQRLMRNAEIVLGYTEQDSKKPRTIEEIRVRLMSHQVEVKSDLDREWKPVKLTDIIVQ